MRKLLGFILLGLSVAGIQAQLFTPESFAGAAVGGVAGGVIGHNHHGQTAEGAAIGAGVGWLLGSIAYQERTTRERIPYSDRYYQEPYFRGYHSRGHVPYRSYHAPRRDYGGLGMILGGVTGGIIGHNHHGQTAEGVAIGAGAGLLLGTIAEDLAREREARRAFERARAREIAAEQARAAARIQAAAPRAEERAMERAPVKRSLPAGEMAAANRLFGR
jgi:uncharacterized protein YcfJ